MSEEKVYQGSDGKRVVLKTPKFLSKDPWYSNEQASKKVKTSWEEKKDVYKNYDPLEYKKVIDKFQQKEEKVQEEEVILDTYSRVKATESKRDRSETAHYLKDICNDLEFSDPPEAEVGAVAEEAVEEVEEEGEDILENGHTTIFGSYWSDGKWGYKCCKQFDKNSKCSLERS